MPVLLLIRRQSLEELLGNDVFNSVQIGLSRVAIEKSALGEVLVHLAAEMMRLHLMLRSFLHRVETHEINIHWFQRRVLLKCLCSSLEDICFGCRLSSGRFASGLARCTTPGQRHDGAGEYPYMK